MDENLPHDLMGDIYRFAVEDESRLNDFRELSHQHRRIAGQEYMKLHGDAEVVKSEIDTYVASNPLSYSIEDATCNYSGSFCL